MAIFVAAIILPSTGLLFKNINVIRQRLKSVIG